MPKKWDSLEQRFFSKVEKTKSCWIFLGARGKPLKSIYPKFSLNGRCVVANRVSWIIHYGRDPGQLLVCHRCDNTKCVNPAHLFLGTDRDNAIDKQEKGRGNQRRGSAHGNAKLTEQKVKEIREKYARGNTTLKAIASEYGVHTSIIQKAITRAMWRHVT